MSLITSEVMLGNETLRRRVCGAIRKIAIGKEGEFARLGLTDPEVIVQPFMLELAANTEAVKQACSECGGGSNIPDSTIEWIVGDAWTKLEKAREVTA
ncbi:hypothetical protein HMPREF1484_00258 [Dermabacter sp. HFH0086]|nr:hypothetical protein HMPREF1484_00258 [Dermabacter sp. HFH0086]